MKLSTSSNIVFDRPDGSFVPMERMMKYAKDAGFDTLDISFYDWSLPNSPFLTENWRAWIDGIAEEKERLGMKFGQCHAYTYDFLNPSLTKEERERHEELVLRSIECCYIVGSRLCVTHPDTDYTAVRQTAVSEEKNLAYFRQLLDKVSQFDMSLAVENMCDITIAPKRKYGAYPEELLALSEKMNDQRFGICWDFEHADIMKQDQRAALKLLGRHLYATHVSDTHSATDPDLMHILPLMGTVNWQEVMETLGEIGYNGYFSFEVNNYGRYFPECLLPEALRLMYHVGEYLMQLVPR